MIFDKEFLESYKVKDVPFGPLGYITYKRTYARFIETEGRTEEWYETCARVLEGNFMLEWDRLHPNKFPPSCLDTFAPSLEFVEEAKQAYDDMFNLRWLPPGRGLWCSGSEVAKKNGATLTNCYYVEVKPQDGKVSYPFVFAMDMLMLGAGVGFGVSKEHIANIPTVPNPVDLFIVCDPTHRDYQFLDTQNSEDWWKVTHQKICVEDSREGWVYALKKVIDSAFLSKRGNRKTLVIDLSKVRSSGELIKGFGGRASGPAPLVELLRSVAKVLNSRVGKLLTDVDCTDIMNLIGRCVVSGNVRRSAMIAIGDGSSVDFRKMKNPLHCDPTETGHIKEFIKNHNEAISNHRWASNNSILVDYGFEASALAESIWVKGEPGFLNPFLSRYFGRLTDGFNPSSDPKASGTNPCGEITLESYEPCNLAEVFPSNCDSIDELHRACVTAYRYAKRVTLSDYPWDKSREVVERNRRIGVSISGIQDWKLKVPELDLPNCLNRLYELVKREDILFSKRLGINESIKLTTVKPSGSISLLAGASNGIHYPYSAYYIRRIQFQDSDPLVAYLKRCGFTTSKAVQTPNASIVQFPIKSKYADHPGFRSAGEVPAREQLEEQLLLQTWWADNQVSCTVSFQENDKEGLAGLIKEYSSKLKSTSFLPYTPALKEHYPDLPFEPISKEVYEEMLSKIKHWPDKILDETELTLLEQDDCPGGVCPIR